MAVSDEEFRKLDALCKQMYEALCRVANLPFEWGGKEVAAAMAAAANYIAERREAE